MGFLPRVQSLFLSIVADNGIGAGPRQLRSELHERRCNLIYLVSVNNRAQIASISKTERELDIDAEETKDLVKRAKAGDRVAFQGLFRRYHRRAFSLALGMVKNPDDAADVVQDAFIKAHRYLPKFQGTSSFYTWFYRIVVNLAIDLMRKKKRTKTVEFDEAIASSGAEDELLLPTMSEQNPEHSLARRRLRDNIAVALEGLSENHRAVIVMRELQGLPYEEMAEIMECSKGTIMSRLFHARRNMQKQLVVLLEDKNAGEDS